LSFGTSLCEAIHGIGRVGASGRELLIALRSRSAHASRHEASDANESAVQIVGADHRATSAVRSIHDSVVRNINPLAINAYAIVTILSFPIDVINALRIAAIAAGVPFRSAAVLIQVRKDKGSIDPHAARSGLTIRSGNNPTSRRRASVAWAAGCA
jgi:hypothetical protein